jgi:hypothetical protein
MAFAVNPTLLSIASPKLSRMISVNPRLSEYALPPISGPIQDFISLLFGETVEITAANSRFLAYMAGHLEIESLQETARQIVKRSDTFERVALFASELISLGLSADAEVRQIAEGFAREGTMARTVEWPVNVLRGVLLSDVFKVEDYNAFVRKEVLPLIEKDPRNNDLVGCVRFGALEADTIRAIVGMPTVNLNVVRRTMAQILTGWVGPKG